MDIWVNSTSESDTNQSINQSNALEKDEVGNDHNADFEMLTDTAGHMSRCDDSQSIIE